MEEKDPIFTKWLSDNKIMIDVLKRQFLNVVEQPSFALLKVGTETVGTYSSVYGRTELDGTVDIYYGNLSTTRELRNGETVTMCYPDGSPNPNCDYPLFYYCWNTGQNPTTYGSKVGDTADYKISVNMPKGDYHFA